MHIFWNTLDSDFQFMALSTIHELFTEWIIHNNKLNHLYDLIAPDVLSGSN